MGNEALQEKYRPYKFEDFAGNKSTVEALKTSLQGSREKLNTILLMGPRGCGKTTLAGIIKNELQVGDRDFTELNTANVRGIDTIRDVQVKAGFLPFEGKTKIFFFDECHKLTNDAQNAMLKLLEKPPAHVIFVLATTDPEKLLPTVLSRCAKFTVDLLKKQEIVALLKGILVKEGVDDYPDEALRAISDVCDGSPREALILLNNTIDILDETVLYQTIRKHIIDADTVKNFCKALMEGQPWKAVVDILKALPGFDDDQEKIRYAVAGYLGAVLLNKADDKIAIMLNEFVNNTFMYTKKAGLILATYNCVTLGK